MTLRERISADMAQILTGEFAEDVTIGGRTVKAVVSREPAPEPGNEIASDGSSARAVVYVAAADYPSPARGDLLTDASGVVWKVVRSSPLPGLSRAVCVSDENPWG